MQLCKIKSFGQRGRQAEVIKAYQTDLSSLGLVSCACLHCTLYGVAYVKPGQVCDSVDAVRRRFKLSQRFTCLCHVCSLQHSADQLREEHSTLYMCMWIMCVCQ